MASSKMFEIMRATAGALVGGVAGFYGYRWMLDRGFLALALPGLLLGAGCGAAAGTRSTSRGVVCGLAGLALGVFAFWRNMAQPTTLPYLVTHLHEIGQIALILLAIGAVGGYWFGRDPLVLGPWANREPARREGVGAANPESFTNPPKPPTMEG